MNQLANKIQRTIEFKHTLINFFIIILGRLALRLFTKSGERFVLRRAYYEWKRFFRLQLNRHV